MENIAKCNQCGEDIIWNDKKLSASGKKIPQDKNGQSHQCAFSKFNQKIDKSLGGTPLEVLAKLVVTVSVLVTRLNRVEDELRWGAYKTIKTEPIKQSEELKWEKADE